MEDIGRPRKPKMDWFLSLRGASSPEREREWAERMTALAGVLQRAAHGCGAEVLARQAGVSIEDAVQHFLGPRGNDLYWTLRLAGNWELLGGDKTPSIGDVRKRLVELEEAYEKLALMMCDRAVGCYDDTEDARAVVWKEFHLLGYLDDEIEGFVAEPELSVKRLNRDASDIRGWMYVFSANGRGSVASIVVAELVAAFFDMARIAGEATGDAQAAKLLGVFFARSGTIPANPYCLAVEAALIALGVQSAPSANFPKGQPGGGWRRAVQDVDANRKKLTASADCVSEP